MTSGIDRFYSNTNETTDNAITEPEKFRGEIVLRNVSFAYPQDPQHEVLHNISLHLQMLTFRFGRSSWREYWDCGRFRFRKKHDFLSFRRSVQSFVGRSASGWSECERFGGRFCSKCDQHCDAWIVTTICRYLKSLFCSLEPFDRTSCTALKLGFWLSNMNSMLQRSSSIRL